MPSPCNLNLLGRELLNALGYPIVGERNEKVVWAIARAPAFNLMGVRIIHFDEAHNVTAEANITEQERIRKTFKTLLNNKVNPLCLIISGTHEIAGFLESITENRRRGRFQQFLPLSTQDLGLMHDIVARLAEFANLNVGWSDTDALLPRLSHAALHQMGTAIEITHEAIDRALREDASVLTVEHFAQVYARRTGNAAPYNPFVAPNWSDIDCKRVLG